MVVYRLKYAGKPFFVFKHNRQMKTKILKALKPKVASLGFNPTERQSIADSIDGNLNLEDDATDEEIDAAINGAITAALPYLQMAQASSTRVINDYKEKNPIKPTDPTTPPANGGNGSETPPQEDEPAWAKAIRESNEAILARLNRADEADRSQAYQKQLADRLKDVDPIFYTREAKKQKFENDEAFETYVEEVVADWTAFNQGKANESLRGSATPAAGGVSKTEADGIGAMISSGTKAIIESQNK